MEEIKEEISGVMTTELFNSDKASSVVSFFLYRVR